MDPIGIDVHKKESQICILAEGGELIEQRVCTEPERFTAVLGEPWKASGLSPSASLGALGDRQNPADGSNDVVYVERLAHAQRGGLFQKLSDLVSQRVPRQKNNPPE